MKREVRSVVSTAGLEDRLLESIRSVSPRIQLVQVSPQPDDLYPLLAEAEVLLTHFRHTHFEPRLSPRLGWIQLVSASVEQILGQPIAATPVLITNCSGIHATPMAEYVLASMLAFTRHFPKFFRHQLDRHWASAQQIYAELVGGELRNRTLGILGYGSIGREVARLASCFGMRILACKRDPEHRGDPGWAAPGTGDRDGSIPQAFFAPDRLHEFLAPCDYVVLSCPLTPATERIIDERALRAMKSTAYLVNVGRGGLIDETALVRALRQGWIGGAGLDVAGAEPLPSDSPLFDLPNLIITPHCSGTTPFYDERSAQLFCDNLALYLEGKPLLNLIDRGLGY